MYIAGTRLDRGISAAAQDLWDDVKIPFGYTSQSQRFEQAQRALIPGIHKLVGHSLGGAVALELAAKHGLQSEVYGTPVASASASAMRHRHPFDPISMFDLGAATTGSPSMDPHRYSGF